MGRYLVLTDMHFGTPESAVNDDGHRRALVARLAAGEWDEIVLAGDIFDANLSTLRSAIEGDPDAGLCGFRQFLRELHAAAAGGLPALARRWVYVPGNHDYKLWDILASRYAFEDVIAGGGVFGKDVPLPLRRHAWTGPEAFLSGLWRGSGFDVSARVTVEYPDHRIAFGDQDLVITHGHYLDPSQTRFNVLSEWLRPGLSLAAWRGAVRKIVIETAQYQTVANAMSFRRDTKGLVDALVGPAGIWSRIQRALAALAAWVASLSFSPRGRRGALSRALLRNVDAYLDFFRDPGDPPPRPVRWFVFGHTHAQGAGETPAGVAVWNAGSCYEDHGRVATWARIETKGDPAAGTERPNVVLEGIPRA